MHNKLLFTFCLLNATPSPVTPFDNALALRQMTEGLIELTSRRASASDSDLTKKHPRLLALGGDHTIGLAELRALVHLHKQPITVLHFDAHLDTWHPSAYDDSWLEPDVPIEQQQSSLTHGTMYWLAWKEGLIANGSVHAGLRTRLSSLEDDENDDSQGWVRIESDAIAHDRLGKSTGPGIVNTCPRHKTTPSTSQIVIGETHVQGAVKHLHPYASMPIECLRMC